MIATRMSAILSVVERQLLWTYDAWIVRRADGFAWWPGVGVRQSVRVQGPATVDGLPTSWLVIETPAGRDLDAARCAARSPRTDARGRARWGREGRRRSGDRVADVARAPRARDGRAERHGVRRSRTDPGTAGVRRF